MTWSFEGKELLQAYFDFCVSQGLTTSLEANPVWRPEQFWSLERLCDVGSNKNQNKCAKVPSMQKFQVNRSNGGWVTCWVRSLSLSGYRYRISQKMGLSNDLSKFWYRSLFFEKFLYKKWIFCRNLQHLWPKIYNKCRFVDVRLIAYLNSFVLNLVVTWCHALSCKHDICNMFMYAFHSLPDPPSLAYTHSDTTAAASVWLSRSSHKAKFRTVNNILT